MRIDTNVPAYDFQYYKYKGFFLHFFFFVLFSNKTETFSDASSVLLIYSKFGYITQV